MAEIQSLNTRDKMFEPLALGYSISVSSKRDYLGVFNYSKNHLIQINNDSIEVLE